MKTLVLKCDGVVNNDNLRKMNELRFTMSASSADALDNPTALSLLGTSALPQWEIIKGNGYFTNANGAQNYSNRREAETVYVYAISDLTISISNFDLISSGLGHSTSQLVIIREQGGSVGQMLLDEIKYKTFLNLIKLGNCSLTGDIITLQNFKSLKEISCGSGSILQGKLSQLPDSIEKLRVSEANQSNVPLGNFEWSMEQIASKTKLNNIIVDGHPTTGGDIYTMLAGKNGDFSLNASRCNLNPLSNIVVTCSYISGVSAIPTINLQTLNLFRTGTISKNDMLNILRLFKDGIDSGKMQITQDADKLAFTVSSVVKADSEINALKTELGQSPYNLVINLF